MTLNAAGTKVTCEHVEHSARWVSIEASDETKAIRKAAAASGLTDSTGWYGAETWFTDHRRHYVMCTLFDNRAMPNGKCSKAPIYFEKIGNSWNATAGEDSPCALN
jgi:hypothetical protein